MSEKPSKDEKRFDSPVNPKRQKLTTEQSQLLNLEKMRAMTLQRKTHFPNYYIQYPFLSSAETNLLPELNEIIATYDLNCEQKCNQINETFILYEDCHCIKEILGEFFKSMFNGS